MHEEQRKAQARALPLGCDDHTASGAHRAIRHSGENDMSCAFLPATFLRILFVTVLTLLVSAPAAAAGGNARDGSDVDDTARLVPPQRWRE